MASDLRLRKADTQRSVSEKEETTSELTWFQTVQSEAIVIIPWVLVLLISMYALGDLKVWTLILTSNRVRRPFFNLGLIFTSFGFLLKWYNEIWVHYICKLPMTYEARPQSTHLLLSIMALSGLFLTIGLWPVWKFMTLIVMLLIGAGVMFPIALIFNTPSTLSENFVFFVLFAFFVYEYTSYSVF